MKSLSLKMKAEKRILIILLQLIYICHHLIKQAKNMLELERDEAEPQEVQDSQENEADENSRNKQLLLIFVVYLLLTIANRMSFLNLSTFKQKIADSMKKTADNTTRQFLNTIDIISGETLQGVWERSDTVESAFLSQANGLFSIRFQRMTKNNKDSDFSVQIDIKNGQYIDNGVLKTKFYFKPDDYISRIRQFPQKNIRQYLFDLNKTNQVMMMHSFHRIFQTVYKDQVTPMKQFSIQINRQSDSFQFNLRLSTLPAFSYKAQLDLQQQLKSRNEFFMQEDTVKKTAFPINQSSEYPYEITFQIQSSQSTIINQIILAVFLGLITYCQVSAITAILIQTGVQLKSVQHISILTLLMTTMWDEAFAFITFHQIYLNGQEALVLFICQAFGFTMLAINLQIRIVYHIFQSRLGVENFRTHVFKFHVIAYSCLILVYPILVYTNLNSYLFITASTLFIPQIISNGVYKVKPDQNDPYYCNFLLPRFLFIIYIRGNPWNIYGLQPNFLLILGCFSVVAVQILGLWVQKTYHPRKIVPKIFLPTVFNYSYDQTKEEDVSDSTKLEASPRQCSICLDRLNKDPYSSFKDTGSNNSTDSAEIFRIMRTPCGHKYHGNCLIQWMKVKKDCPLCRQNLPPYD